LSLEAAINRLFFDTFERDDEFRREIKSTIPSSVVKYIKESWDNMSVRNKYILLPPLISYYEFDISKMPFSLFDEFRRFRNRLVHSKMHITSFTIEVTDVDENSISGNVLEHSTNAPDSISTFPITGFSTSFRDLSVKDAEKSFEIAYRMRMELFFQCNGSLPHLLYKSNKGELKYEIGDSIAKHIIPSFGEF
jgi:hypothetical protein